jgi:hypothetical protein
VPAPVQLIVISVAFGTGVAVAEVLGAVNLGVALGVGQLAFAGALVWALLHA